MKRRSSHQTTPTHPSPDPGLPHRDPFRYSIVPWIHGASEATAQSGSVQEAIYVCAKAVAEVHQACIEAGESTAQARESMRLTWLAALPQLTSVHNIRCYIALVSWAQVSLKLSAREAKDLAYIAQVALQAAKLVQP